MEKRAIARGGVNVELSHIYVDQEMSEEQYRSAVLAQEFVVRQSEQGHVVTITILIDDYNPTSWTLDVAQYVECLRSTGISVDFLVYESALPRYAPCLLCQLPQRQHGYYADYHQRTGKYPCSFLVAVWHLARLGAFEFGDAIAVRPECVSSFASERVMTVLPERFRSVERSALKLLKASSFWTGISDRIDYLFY